MKKIFLILFIGCVSPHHEQRPFIVVRKSNGLTHMVGAYDKIRHHYVTKEPNTYQPGDTVWLFRNEYWEIKPQF